MAGIEDCPLGDDLIERIFSFLPTKDVVKTCVLSKRWRPYWKTVPNLRFSVSSYRDDPSGDRVQFADRALARYKLKKVQNVPPCPPVRVLRPA